MFNRHRTLGRLAWRISERASRRYAPRLINDPPFESCLLTGAVCLLSFAFAFSRVSTQQMFRNMSACARESRPIRENREAARNAMACTHDLYRHAERKPLAKSRSEKRPTLNAQS